MSVTDDIKARIDILDLMQSYNVQVRKAGRSYKANCPFHNERTPSFVVYPDSGTWRCFGACGEGGDIFNFVMKQENLDFVGAMTLLAKRAGVELRPRTDEQKNREAALDRMRGLLEETARYFHSQLNDSRMAGEARAYVKKRGLTPETVDRFLIGYAPNDWRAALTHLGALGYTEAEILAAGVATRNDKGDVYDRFRNRLVIPIRDGRGGMSGFGARALAKDDIPKYLNSPQTPLFDKGHTLFAFDVARRAIRETETAVIVEGYMDALQAHQAGFANVVAGMGTALTEPQLKQLGRYAKRLILALDPDAAGVSATMRGLNVIRKALGDYRPVHDPKVVMRLSHELDIDVRILTMPDGLDPDDLIRETPERWPQLIESAPSVVDYVIDTGTASVTSSTSLGERERIGHELLPMLFENVPQRLYVMQRLAHKLRINEQDLMQFVQRRANDPIQPTELKDQRNIDKYIAPAKPKMAAARPSDAPKPTVIAPVIAIESYCLAILIRRPDLWPVINRQFALLAAQLNSAIGISNGQATREYASLLGEFSAKDFTRADYQAILGVLKAATEQDELESLEFMRQTLPPELNDEMDGLLVSPLESIQREGTWEARETESILKERALVLVDRRLDEELIERALQLRWRRLKHEADELYFLQSEPAQSDNRALQEQISRAGRARRAIEAALRDLKMVQRQT